MPILFNYLMRFFLAGFFRTIGVFLGLFLLIDGIEAIRRYTPKPNFNLPDILLLILSRIPNFLGMLTPSIVLLATLMGVARLVRQNEITVMRASGISLPGILLPFLAGGLIVALLHGILVTQIAPRTYRIAQQIEDRIVDRHVAPLSQTGELWFRDGIQIIHAQRIDPPAKTLHEVTVFTFNPDHRLAARLEAKTATHDETGWQLRNGIDYRFVPTTDIQPFQQRPWSVSLDPQRLSVETPLPQMLTALELYALFQRLEQEGYDATRYQVVFHRRLASPATTLAAILLAFPFALRLPRSGGALRSMLLGILLGFAMFVLQDLATALGMGSRLPPMLAAWAPVLFFCGIAGFLLVHLASPQRSGSPTLRHFKRIR
ncbi:MAG: LPS export ABC transporter permease LptG [Magnetococcales bacterium]|nr:LPS export ABC transporter permease LptG [Magnetococcales bacterium]